MGLMRVGGLVALAAGVTTLIALLQASTAVAYERYSSCRGCHGSFFGPTSPKHTVFPSNSKHTMHAGSAYMAANCNLCHRSGDNYNPYLGWSNGTDSNPPIGCIGCHGREYGSDVGYSGVGLRAHHEANGLSCSHCHPQDPTPLPESVKPTYYGTIDTRVDDPCNTAPDHLENWSVGDTEGLNNDGDDGYDDADADCAGCVGDLDGDGTTGQADLGILLGDWGCTGGHCVGDLDGDGSTGQADLGILLGDWGCGT
jgi:hypothetical protein